MPQIFTLPQYTPLRRKLRKSSTQSEDWLWYQLQDRKLMGYKFRRQHSIGRYIMDFFCPKAMLCVEVDGASHLDPEVQANDKVRQAWIESQGVRVVRFTDNEVLSDTEVVLEKIKQVLLSSHPS